MCLIFNLLLDLGHEPFIDLEDIGSDTDGGARLRSPTVWQDAKPSETTKPGPMER